MFRSVLPEKIPDYEVREQQIEMALLVEQALREERHALVEAGTGTGKSFAYLVPLASAWMAAGWWSAPAPSLCRSN